MFPSSFSLLSCHRLFFLSYLMSFSFSHLCLYAPLRASLPPSLSGFQPLFQCTSLYHLLTPLLFSRLYQVMQLQQQLWTPDSRDNGVRQSLGNFCEVTVCTVQVHKTVVDSMEIRVMCCTTYSGFQVNF